MSLKNRVWQAVKKELEEHRNSNGWLQDSIPFDGDLRLPDEYGPMVEKLFNLLTTAATGYKANQKSLDLEILLANLFHQSRKPISISLDRNSWRSSRYSRASFFTIQLIALLHQKGLIHMKRGYRTATESRRTRIWATKALLDCCPIYPEAVKYDPVEVVELRNENGDLMEYRDTAETIRIRKILEKANKINSAARIEHAGYTIKTFLRAIFERKFTLYGRLHTRGYRHYQGLSGDERAEITIDGEPVVELDFSGLHPRLLYAADGIQYDADPYSAVHADPKARPFLKIILLAMLNAKDRASAEKAANFWVFNHPSEKAVLAEIGITRARPLMDSFEQAHAPISKHFCRGKETGLKIMNIDSRIALEVIKSFADAEVPILAIHDSFIVQANYREHLQDAMSRAYQHQTRGFQCPIK